MSRVVRQEGSSQVMPGDLMDAEPSKDLEKLLARYYAADAKNAAGMVEEILDLLKGLILWRLQQERLSYDEREEFYQQSRIAIVESLQSGRESGNRISNLSTYTLTVVRHLVAEEKRKGTPRRLMSRRVHYIVTQSIHKHHFAVWQLLAATLIGLKAWIGRPVDETARYGAFCHDDTDFLQKCLDGGEPDQIEPWHLLLKLFEWIQTPLEKPILVGHLLALQPITQQEIYALEEIPEGELPATQSEETRRDWDACWQAICALRPLSRAAFLLMLDPELLVLISGQIEPQQIVADLLGISLDEMQTLWRRLPLEDREIAQWLKTTVENVQTMRSRCRSRINRDVGLPPLL
jgi:DNA-directed RNA polymerase specialized sigma24 family protein